MKLRDPPRMEPCSLASKPLPDGRQAQEIVLGFLSETKKVNFFGFF
jgi:hypothetical protein